MMNMAAQLTAASKAQAAELAALKAQNEAQAKELATLKAASAASQKQQQKAASPPPSSAAPEKKDTADWKDQAIKDLQARMQALEASHSKPSSEVGTLQPENSSTRNSSPDSAAVPAAAAPTAAPHQATSDSSSAGTTAQEKPSVPETAGASASAPAPAPAPAVPQPATQRATTPPQPAEAFETLARSLAQLVGGALQKDVTPLLDTVLELATGRTPTAAQRTFAEPRGAAASPTVDSVRAARTQAAGSRGRSCRQPTIHESMERLREARVARGNAMAQARTAQPSAAVPKPAAQIQKDVKAPFASPLQAPHSVTPSPAAAPRMSLS